MLLKINNGKKEFSGETLFENVDFEVKGTEKIAIVGRNGCGKTTLLKILTEQESLDEGQLIINNHATVAMLSQKAFKDESLTVRQCFDQIYQHVIDIKNKMDSVAKQLENDYSEALIN